MKLLKKLIIFLILISNIIAFADNSIVLKAGDKAPFDGILLNQTNAESLKTKVLQLGICTDLNTSLTNSNKLLQDISTQDELKIKAYAAQDNDLAKKTAEEKTTSDLEKFAFFGLGILTTSFAIYGASKLIK
jgi:hypothetical protein